jgi:hypothetical protein
MSVVPAVCAVAGAVLPFMPPADPLGFAALPARFFLILIGIIAAAYLMLVELAKSPSAPPSRTCGAESGRASDTTAVT